MPQIAVNDEGAFMGYSEEVIYELQNVLKSKPDMIHYPVLKKAMEIEEYLYCDALRKTRLSVSDGHVWQSRDSIREYQISAEKLIKRMRERDGDWVKLFNLPDIKNFVFQVYQDYIPTKRVERKLAAMSNKKKAFSSQKSIGKNVGLKARSSNNPQAVISSDGISSRTKEIPRVKLEPPPLLSAPETALPISVLVDAFPDGNIEMTNAPEANNIADASALLDTMYFDEDIAEAEDSLQDLNSQEQAAGNVFSASQLLDDVYSNADFGDAENLKNESAPLASSFSRALLSGMVEEYEGMDQGASSSLDAPHSRSQQESGVAHVVPKSTDDERTERINAQRELERKKLQEMKPVSDLDRSRKYMLFGEEDDDSDNN